jgi:hypothetical protein
MINENQKKTTQEYRDNYDRIFGKKEKKDVVETTTTVADHPDAVVGSCTTEGDGVEDKGGPGSGTMGQGDL